MNYPVRCRIIDVTGQEVFPGIIGKTPNESKPHVGKKGLAELIDGAVRITLDDGNVVYGYECWWESLEDKPKKHIQNLCPLCGRIDPHSHTAGPFGMT